MAIIGAWRIVGLARFLTDAVRARSGAANSVRACLTQSEARGANAVDAVLVFTTFVMEPARLARREALDALTAEAGAGAAFA